MKYRFTAKGYDFYQAAGGYWQCVHQGEPAPRDTGGYGSVASLAKLKGIDARDLPEPFRKA